MLPSVSVNSGFPIGNNVPMSDKAKVSSIDAGLSGSIGASAAGTYTAELVQSYLGNNHKMYY